MLLSFLERLGVKCDMDWDNEVTMHVADSVVVSYDDTSLGNWEIVPGSVEVPG